MTVTLRHPGTGETRVLQQGWSWGCFLGCGFLGIPLYRRGLQVWGSAMVAFNIVALIVEFVPTEHAASLDLWMTVGYIALCAFFGMRANQMAIDRYRDLGWVFADPRRNLL
jgi:hypothetical protein